jgi:hypothetical protein
MESISIEFPKKITSNYNGFKALICFYKELSVISDTKIIIDFRKCRYFEANLSSVLGAIFSSISMRNNNEIQISNLNYALDNIFKRNGFLSKFGTAKMPDEYNTTISYQEFEEDKGVNFKDYIRDNLLRKDDFPELSVLAEKKINESIFELFENAHTHGNCDKIHTCGQYFPNHNPPRIDMTIVDLGQSIKANVNRHLEMIGKNIISGTEAIQWAVIKGHTTKIGNNPGGLGLDVIREFVDLNKGKLQIVSSDGFWEYKKGKASTKTLSESFPGTIANLEFNLDDKNFYQLSSEVSLDNIF